MGMNRVLNHGSGLMRAININEIKATSRKQGQQILRSSLVFSNVLRQAGASNIGIEEILDRNTQKCQKGVF